MTSLSRLSCIQPSVSPAAEVIGCRGPDTVSRIEPTWWPSEERRTPAGRWKTSAACESADDPCPTHIGERTDPLTYSSASGLPTGHFPLLWPASSYSAARASEKLSIAVRRSFGKQVAVALPHRLGLVAHPLVDDPLVDAPRGQVRGERVPVGVEPDLEPALLAAQAPRRTPQRLAEVAGGRLHGERASGSASHTTYCPRGRSLAPGQQQRLQLRVQVDPPRGLGLLPRLLLAPGDDRVLVELDVRPA